MFVTCEFLIEYLDDLLKEARVQKQNYDGKTKYDFSEINRK